MIKNWEKKVYKHETCSRKAAYQSHEEKKIRNNIIKVLIAVLITWLKELLQIIIKNSSKTSNKAKIKKFI